MESTCQYKKSEQKKVFRHFWFSHVILFCLVFTLFEYFYCIVPRTISLNFSFFFQHHHGCELDSRLSLRWDFCAVLRVQLCPREAGGNW